MKQYKVGEFAQNLGVSVGFLKHHERYGLLTPQVSESGYRYYQLSDGMQVLNCLKLQGMGFTSKEVSQILLNSADIDMPSLLKKRREALERQILLEQETLTYLKHLEQVTTDVAAAGGELFTIEQVEPFYYLENVREAQFVESAEIFETVANWNEMMPLVENASLFDGVSLADGHAQADTYNMGLYIPQRIAQRLGAKITGAVRCMEPRRCLVYRYLGLRPRSYHIRQRSVDRAILRPLTLCAQHNLPIAGSVFTYRPFCSLANHENLLIETALVPLK